MSAWAKPGVKCVCIDAIWEVGGQCPISKDKVYTIAWVGDDGGGWGAHGAAKIVIGLVGAENWASWHGGFAVTRFRPLITKTQEQDVQMILSLLAPEQVSA